MNQAIRLWADLKRKRIALRLIKEVHAENLKLRKLLHEALLVLDDSDQDQAEDLMERIGQALVSNEPP